MDDNKLSQHRFGTTLAYHLLPGIAILGGFLLIAPLVKQSGWPSAVGLWLAALLVLVPLELGILYWQARKHNGTFSLEGIVLYREKTPWLQFAGLALAALVGAILCFMTFTPLDTTLQAWFVWLPGWFFFGSEDLSVYSPAIQFINWLGITLVTGFLAPYVEELYFRGFLLPRMAWMGKWAPLVEAFLFALYHFWSPWQLVTRFLAVLPLVYIVYWKRNLRIGVATHWVLNVVGSLELLLAVFK